MAAFGLSNVLSFFSTGRPLPRVAPFNEAGVAGTAVFGGYVQNKERSSKLYGQEKYRTASDIMTNVSIVAAGLRYFLNLLAKPKWTVEPADDSTEAQDIADFVEECMEDMKTPWPRLIRRSGLYRFYGFGIQEWTAKKRDDGKIGMDDVESRPQWTIEQWEVDEGGTVTGMWQRSPQTGQLLGLPRGKVIYLLDDTFTDSPEGLGWFRQLVDPAERMRNYLQLEGYGFQRDLSGTPIGRAPLLQMNEAIKNGTLTQDKANEFLAGLEEFVKLKSKQPDTGLLLDSSTYTSQTADGFSVSGSPKWNLELLTGGVTSLDKVGLAIDRVTIDMARVMGVEQILLGSNGGSLALSKDKSNNMYLQVDSALGDMTSQFTMDWVRPLAKLNGWPKELWPKLKTEDVAFKDIDQIAATLRDMATAGAILAPDDPVIDEVRELMGLSPQPDKTSQEMGALPHTGMPDPNQQTQQSTDISEMQNLLNPEDQANPGLGLKKKLSRRKKI